jgi:hypothetical protein
MHCKESENRRRGLIRGIISDFLGKGKEIYEELQTEYLVSRLIYEH